MGLLLKAARPTEVSGHFAPDAKRGIQTPVRVVARQGEVEAGRSRHDDPAVGLEGEAPGALRATEAREHAATQAKREIQGAVRVVARQGEVETEKQKGRSCHDDPAVGLEGQGRGFLTAPEVGDHPAPGAKRCVEIAGGGVHRVRETQNQEQSRQQSQERIARM